MFSFCGNVAAILLTADSLTVYLTSNGHGLAQKVVTFRMFLNTVTTFDSFFLLNCFQPQNVPK